MESTEVTTEEVERSREDFQPVKSRKRKSKETQMESVTDEVPSKRPLFPPIAPEALDDTEDSLRKVPVPSNRYTPLKQNWEKIYTPIVEHLKLQVRFNLQTRNVEIKTCEETKSIGGASVNVSSSWCCNCCILLQLLHTAAHCCIL